MLLYRAVGVSLAAPPWRVNRPAGAVERAFHVLSYEALHHKSLLPLTFNSETVLLVQGRV